MHHQPICSVYLRRFEGNSFARKFQAENYQRQTVMKRLEEESF